MKEKLRKPYMILLAAAMLFTLVMAFAACDSQDKKEPSATYSEPTAQPSMESGDDLTLTADGPTSLAAGETVTYRVSLTDCKVSEGLLGIDFVVEYNTDLLTYTDSVLEKGPADTWEIYSRTEVDGQRIFTCLDDAVENPVTGDGQFVMAITFTVKDKLESENDTLIKLINVTGAVNDDEVSDALGNGNEIKKA